MRRAKHQCQTIATGAGLRSHFPSSFGPWQPGPGSQTRTAADALPIPEGGLVAFLPVAVGGTAGTTLAVVRTDLPDLVMAVDDALEREEIDDDEHRALLTSIEQRHPA